MPSKKNPAKEAFGQWRALPEKLPRAWYSVTPYARFMGLELFRCCDDDYQGVVETTSRDTWMDDACRQLQLDGHHRQVAKQALALLVKAGLVRVFENNIFVDVGQKGQLADSKRAESPLPQVEAEPSRSPSGAKAEAKRRRSGAKAEPNPKTSQLSDIAHITSNRVGEERAGQDRKGHDHLRDHVLHENSPALFPGLVLTDDSDARAKRNRQRREAQRDPLVAAASDEWLRLFKNRWFCHHNLKDSEIADFLESCRHSAYWPDGTRYDLLSIAKCVMWGYIHDDSPSLLKKHHPLKWIFDFNRFAQYLHEYPADIPDEYRPVRVAEAAAE